MDERKLDMIIELMEGLREEMAPSADEFADRLGRKKPEVAAISIETEEPMMGEDMEEEMPMEGPEQKLKERLMKMRG